MSSIRLKLSALLHLLDTPEERRITNRHIETSFFVHQREKYSVVIAWLNQIDRCLGDVVDV